MIEVHFKKEHVKLTFNKANVDLHQKNKKIYFLWSLVYNNSLGYK